MELPDTMVYRYLKEKLKILSTGVVKIGTNFYLVTLQNGTTDYLKWFDSKYALKEGASMEVLDQLYIKKISKFIDQQIKFSLEETVNKKEKEILEKARSLVKLNENAFFAKKVLEEIIPAFDLKPKKNLKVSENKNAFELELNLEEALSTEDSVLIGDFLFINHKWYKLSKTQFSNHDSVYIYLNGVVYHIEEGGRFDLDEFNLNHKETIKSKIKNFVEKKESLLKNKLEALAKEEELIKKLSMQEYIDPERKVGFKITRGKFHVCYLLDESYILYDPINKRYYGFGLKFGKPAALIGIPVIKLEDKIVIEKPVVINKYKHPSLFDHAEYQEICTGGYEDIRPKQTGEKEFSNTLVSVLNSVVDSFTKGYTGMAEWRKFHANESYWKDHELSADEINKNIISNMSFVNQLENGLLQAESGI